LGNKIKNIRNRIKKYKKPLPLLRRGLPFTGESTVREILLIKQVLKNKHVSDKWLKVIS